MKKVITHGDLLFILAEEIQKFDKLVDGIGGMSQDEAEASGRVSMLVDLLDQLESEEEV